MPRMKSSRIGALSFCVGISALFACSSTDTVLSLNVQKANSDVGEISRIHVTAEQGSHAKVEQDITWHTQTTGSAGMTMTTQVDKFFERITLPDDWSDGAATVDVQSYDASGAPYLHPEKQIVDIRDSGVVAVFFKLEKPMEEGENGGTGGGGGETGGGGDTAGGGTAGTDTAGGGTGG